LDWPIVLLLKNAHDFLRIRHAIQEKRWLLCHGCLRVDATEDFHAGIMLNPEEIAPAFQGQMAFR